MCLCCFHISTCWLAARRFTSAAATSAACFCFACLLLHLLSSPFAAAAAVLLQIHVLDGGKKVHIYSRNAEDMTPRYPDILSRLPSWLAEGTTSIVLDGEAVAWDTDKAKILPFQVCDWAH